MNINTLILAILNAGDSTGYEIKKMSTDGQFSHFVDISFGSIYPALTKLEQQELVTCQFEAQTGKPDRKVYSITNAGRQEFMRAISQPPAPDKFKSEFLLVAMNAGLAETKSVEEAIKARTLFLQAKQAMIQSVLDDCSHEATKWACNYAMHCVSCDLEYLTNNKQQLLAVAGTDSQAVLGQAAE